jgi:hypothetical protein
MERASVVSAGDMRALTDSQIVRDIAREMNMSDQIVAREMVAARDSFSRFTRRTLTSVLRVESFAMSCSDADVVIETRRRLSRLEIQMPEREDVTWLGSTATRATPVTYAFDRLDVDLRADAGAGSDAPGGPGGPGAENGVQ